MIFRHKYDTSIPPVFIYRRETGKCLKRKVLESERFRNSLCQKRKVTEMDTDSQSPKLSASIIISFIIINLSDSDTFMLLQWAICRERRDKEKAIMLHLGSFQILNSPIFLPDTLNDPVPILQFILLECKVFSLTSWHWITYQSFGRKKIMSNLYRRAWGILSETVIYVAYSKSR